MPAFTNAQDKTNTKEKDSTSTEKKATIEQTLKYLNAFNTNVKIGELEYAHPRFRYDYKSNQVTIRRYFLDYFNGISKMNNELDSKCLISINLLMDYKYQIIDDTYNKILTVEFENKNGVDPYIDCNKEYKFDAVIIRYKEPRIADAFIHLLKSAHAKRKNKYETLKF